MTSYDKATIAIDAIQDAIDNMDNDISVATTCVDMVAANICKWLEVGCKRRCAVLVTDLSVAVGKLYNVYSNHILLESLATQLDDMAEII
jgi:hypothetical protein